MPTLRKTHTTSDRSRDGRVGHRRHSKCRLTVRLANTHEKPLNVEIAAQPIPLNIRSAERLAETFAALGHQVRLRILGKLLQGAASYEALVRVTGVRSGPLYFHLEQLRSAHLVGPKRRDSYELTQRGEAVALVASVLSKLRVR